MRKKTKKQKDKEKELEKEKEKTMLKQTLELIFKENTQLKAVLDDMKANVAENKLQLQETIKRITDKDTAVAMLTTQIDQLKQKFNELQSKQKLISINNIYGSEETFIFKNTETANTTSPHFIKNKKGLKDITEQNKNNDNNNNEENLQNEKLIEENIKKQKMFLQNQQDIQNSILDLKREVLFLQDQINEQKNNTISYQYNLNVEKILKENDIDKLEKFFGVSGVDNNVNNNLFYLVSNEGRVYKIKKRNDLSKNDFLDKIELDYNKRFSEDIINLRETLNNSDNNFEEDEQNKITFNNYIKEIQSDINKKKNSRYNNINNEDGYNSDENYSFDYEDKDYEKEKKRDIKNDNNENEKDNNINNFVNDIMKGSFVL